MIINQANIDNLTHLWKKYGTRTLKLKTTQNERQSSLLHINTHWPYRCWFDEPYLRQDTLALESLPPSTIYPVWPNFSLKQKTKQTLAEQHKVERELSSNNWRCILEQTAMFFPLNQQTTAELANYHSASTNFSVKKLTTVTELALWLNIASKAFGYAIEQLVFEKLMAEQDSQILLAYDNNVPVATALLFKTDNIIGIHQVAVHPNMQGKGYARMLMKALINKSYEWQGSHIVLQASAAGKPLYDSLGFKNQFLIKSYQK